MNLEDAGSISSVIGLFLTVGVTIFSIVINNRVNRIKKKLFIHQGLPQKVKELERIKSDFQVKMVNYPDSQREIQTLISLSLVSLENLKSNLSRNVHVRINPIINQTKRIKKGKYVSVANNKFSIMKLLTGRKEISEENLWDYYSDLSAITHDMKIIINDFKTIGQYG